MDDNATFAYLHNRYQVSSVTIPGPQTIISWVQRSDMSSVREKAVQEQNLFLHEMCPLLAKCRDDVEIMLIRTG